MPLVDNQSHAHAALLARARNYVTTLPSAVSGEHGHDAAFRVAATLVHGFALSGSDAMPIIEEYNARCVPPWSRKELEHKLRSAARWTKYDKPHGHLIGASREVAAAQPPAPRPKKDILFQWLAHEPASIPSCPQIAPPAAAGAGAAKDNLLSAAQFAADTSGPGLSPADLAEARRIATELVKLHRAGAIRDAQDPEASFYANLIQSFQAEFIGKGPILKNAPTPTAP
jgi:hypothetical protein